MYYVKKRFVVKYAENVHQKPVEELYLALVNSLQYTQYIQQTCL